MEKKIEMRVMNLLESCFFLQFILIDMLNNLMFIPTFPRKHETFQHKPI